MSRTRLALACFVGAVGVAACNQLLGINPGTEGAGGQGGGASNTHAASSTGGARASATTATSTTTASSTTTTTGPSTGTASSATTATSTSTASSTTTSTGSSTSTSSGTGGGAAVSLQDLVLLLHMDETSWPSPGSVKDSSTQHNDGTAMGSAVPTPSGKLGGAGLFDGNGYVSVANSQSLQGPMSALTYTAWIYPTGLGPTCTAGEVPFGGIIAKRQDYGVDVAFTMFLWNNDQLYVDVESVRFNSNATFANGQWYHVAVVYDGSLPSGERTTIYVNGAKDQVGDGPAGSIGTHMAALTVGDLTLQTPDSCEFFQGKIDEVAVWTRALSAAEIQALYQSTTEL